MALLKQKKSLVGLGTLIIIIAMILTAAIAAGVLIRTAGLLQQKSLQVGTEAQQQVSAFLQVMSIKAFNASSSSFSQVEMIVRLATSSDDLRLNDTWFSLITKDESIAIHYGSLGSTGYSTDVNTSKGNFTVVFLLQAANHKDNILAHGETIKIYFSTGTPIGEDEEVIINTVTKRGIVQTWRFLTPTYINNERVALYPR